MYPGGGDRELFDFSRRVARRALAQSGCDEHRRCIMDPLLVAVAIQFKLNGIKAFHTGLTFHTELISLSLM